MSLNFALRDALEMDDRLIDSGVQSDVFHMNFVPGADLTAVVESCRRTRRLVLLDDSKTVTKFGDILIAELGQSTVSAEVLSFCRRGCPDEDYGANEDRLAPDFEQALKFIRQA